MDEDRLRRLIEIFTESGLEELEIDRGFWHGTRIRLSRRRSSSAPTADSGADTPRAATPRAEATGFAPAASVTPDAAEPSRAEEGGRGIHTIHSPMVGTFHRSPSPEEAPFAREGDRVEPGQTICIIEAMKIMNEIEADVTGEIVEILIGDGDPVEYSQSLITIRPS